jgi:hypothetical protein
VTELVWYAAYGSNLSRERFEIYLDGGRPRGSTHDYPGCRDATRPRLDLAREIEAELVFGGTSQTWGGGVAFVVPGGPDGEHLTKARLYLLTLEQIADVVAQENWLDPGTVVLAEETLTGPTELEGGHMYGTILPLTPHDERPVLTVTQPSDTAAAAPSRAYLRHIADGLREAHAMSGADIAEYLSSKRGMTASSDQLQSLIDLG